LYAYFGCFSFETFSNDCVEIYCQSVLSQNNVVFSY